MLLSTGAAFADCGSSCDTSCDNNGSNNVVTTLIPRSQSFNNVIKSAGLDPDGEFQDEMDCFNGNFSIALEYQQTFRNSRFADCYFGPAVSCPASDCDDNGAIVRVRGSLASPNGTTDLVADNFFLPRNFESTLSFSPSIKNINVHFQFYAGLDEWANGLYFRLYAPVTNSRWNLDVCENLVTEGTMGFQAGVIAPGAVAAGSLFQNFTSFARGNALTDITGITVQPLKNAKFSCDTLTETKLADLRAELGWNFCMNEDYHIGLYIEAAAPTGNKPCAEFLFSPIAGNGHFWELGGGLTAHYTFWRCEDADKQFDFFLDATVTHMFKRSECRTFDLVDKPLSRYMIAEQLTTTVTGLRASSDDGTTFVTPNAQFNGVYAPVANFSTQEVDVSIAAQGEVTAKFVYTCSGFSWELGYDFYGRSCEDISFDCDCATFPASTWALRGDAQVYGFADTTAIALGATRSAANVFSLSGGGTPNNVAVDNSNNQVNNPIVAYPTTGLLPLGSAPADAAGPISTSNAAVFITLDDINFNGAETRLISNKIFTHFNYTWIDCEDWIPYVGIGASVEFGSTGHHNDCCDTTTTPTTPTTTVNSCDDDCDSCLKCTPSFWAVWIKGGLSFN